MRLENPERFTTLVAGLQLGKRLPTAVYLHAVSLDHIANELRDAIERAAAVAGGGTTWNVVKLSVDAARVSLLDYPNFFDEAFPALESSALVDLTTGQVARRQYGGQNPPILHRKEALLPPDHPLVPVATALTRTAEQHGLFDEVATIGNKRAWQARLEVLGLRVEGHELHGGSEQGPLVHRHRTALARHGLSTPMQALWRHGFLDGRHTVFDYGCGRGDDLRTLTERGLDAHGWDPHFAAEGPLLEADIVNVGFVLNVIEDVGERDQALRRAWSLTRRLLVVGVLLSGRSAYERCRLFRDGVLTSRGTFQKHYTPAELRAYLDAMLARESVAVAPGIAFVFRHDADEQAFLVGRTSSRRSTAAPSSARRPPRAPRVPREPQAPREPRTPREPRAPRVRVRAPTKWDIHAGLVEAFWDKCVELGRAPESDEFEQLDDLRERLGGANVVLRHLLKTRDANSFDAAVEERRGGLLVFLALNLFERRRSFGGLPAAIRRDIKTMFGSYQAAQAEAQTLLFSAGEPTVIAAACAEAATRGLGFLDGDRSLHLHTSMARALPSVLRVYVGCAARLYGDVEAADLVKIHAQSGKLSLLSYDDFEGKAVPNLVERVKINLRSQHLDFFEYGTPQNPSRPLYLKSRYLSRTFPGYEEQVEFDRTLLETNLFDLSGHGPSRKQFEEGLARAGLIVDGAQLCGAESCPFEVPAGATMLPP